MLVVCVHAWNGELLVVCVHGWMQGCEPALYARCYAREHCPALLWHASLDAAQVGVAVGRRMVCCQGRRRSAEELTDQRPRVQLPTHMHPYGQRHSQLHLQVGAAQEIERKR
jgi:hypothetical protein